MPTSNLALAPAVLHLVNLARAAVKLQRASVVGGLYGAEAPPVRLLDVGPGHGKYAVLVPEYVTGPWHIDAVEAEERYITHQLRSLYVELWNTDVLDLTTYDLNAYDIVLMVDVIEHLEKADALSLLERIPGHVVICTPEEWFQNPQADEYPSERHRSLWQAGDFPQHRVRDLSSLYGGLLVWLDAQR